MWYVGCSTRSPRWWVRSPLALLLKASGPAAVLVAAAAASALAGVLVLRVRYEAPPRLTKAHAGTPVAEALEGIRVISTDRTLTMLTGLTTLQTFTRGALSVFSVVVAIKLLGAGAAGVGLLTAAVGAGAIIGSLSAALLVGHGGLARWFGIGVAAWGAPLAVIALLANLWSAILMLAIVGIGNALVDVGVFTLLARLTEDAVLARVYAAFEGIITLGVAAGAIATPALIAALGIRGALVAIAVVAPAGVVIYWRPLRVLDDRMQVQDADVALLRRLPMLRPLPTVTIEHLATRLTRAQLTAGTPVFEQGDQGDDFYVIEQGHADVLCDGRRIHVLESGEGFGEVALIRGCRRTATVRATTALTLRTLSRAAFVTAVTGYADSALVVDEVIAGHLSRASPGATPPSVDLPARD